MTPQNDHGHDDESNCLRAAKLRVCFVQAYREPNYIRGHSIRNALGAAKEIHLVLAVNRSRGIKRYWESIRDLLRARRQFDPDVYILGFRGHEIAWLVRWITKNRPLVFDALMSPYAAMAEEAKLGAVGKTLAPLWRWYEAATLRRADAIVTDTRLHAEFFMAEFGLPPQKIVALPVAAIETLSSSQKPYEPSNSTFQVLFYGSFLPLHGVDTIVHAAAQLNDLAVEFKFIGGTERQALWLHTTCAELGVVNYKYQAWVPFERLLHHEIPKADLCLGGPFGGTLQARRVITGKASQCMALGKATVIGKIDEDFGFINRTNCLLVDQGDANQLAAAIRWSYDNRQELPAIGRRGQALYAERLSTSIVGERLLPLLHRLAHGDFSGVKR